MERNAEREIRMSGDGLDRRLTPRQVATSQILRLPSALPGDERPSGLNARLLTPSFPGSQPNGSNTSRLDNAIPSRISGLHSKESFGLLNVGRLGCQFLRAAAKRVRYKSLPALGGLFGNSSLPQGHAIPSEVPPPRPHRRKDELVRRHAFWSL
jgi:hypothetical protein